MRMFLLPSLLVPLTAVACFASDESRLFGFIPATPEMALPAFNGSTRFSRDFVPSTSTWDEKADERAVFLGRLVHSQDEANSWELRLGKGGQIYSFAGPFGESIPPQTHPWTLREGVRNHSLWVDDVWQAVAVCLRKQNHDKIYHENTKRAPQNRIYNMFYFIHQAGVYLREPTQEETFYSPELGSYWAETERTFYVINWGQQANPPSIHKSGALFYTKYRDCGDGTIEVTYLLYNFGEDELDYLNTPWGGVRTSSLPVQWLSTPAGELERKRNRFGEGLKQIDETGGFFLWAQEGDSADRYALGLVYGKDRHYSSPEGGYERRSSRIRYGFAGANELRDYSVFTVNPRPCVRPGSCFFWRNYFVVGTFAEVVRRSRSLVKSADYGILNIAEEASPLLPYVLSEDPLTGQNVLNSQDEADGGRPDALLYAWPVEKSLPLILMRDTQANKLFVSVDPYINSATVPFENPYKPGDEKHQRYQNRLCYRQYEGTEYIGLLGFVLTKDCITGDKTEYAPLSSVLDDKEYRRLP